MFSLSRSTSFDSPLMMRKVGDEEKKLSNSSSKDSLYIETGLSISEDCIHIEHQETFTQKTFKELIKEARETQRDYFFVLIEDMSEKKCFFFDGISFVKWASTKNEKDDEILRNPLNREPVISVDFYIIAKDVEVTELDVEITEFHKYDIPHFCNWEEYQTKEKYLYFDHLIALSDPELKKERRYVLEYNLALDFLFGRGIPSNIEKAVNYIEEKANEDNFLCAFLLSLCFKFGIGKVIDHSRFDIWFKNFNGSPTLYKYEDLIKEIYIEAKKYLTSNDLLYKIIQTIDSF